MTEERKNIKIPESLFAQLKSDKGRYKSWPQYLHDECLGDSSSQEVDTDKIVADLKAQLPASVADEIEERLR